MNKALEAKLKTLPRSPGVYFHKSESGEIIYVGKAAVLKNRVRQYFQSSKDMDVKTRALVAEIYDTDWTETESEIDALFLESEMVKRYMPRFNILLRDDKSQIFVRIDMKNEWPYLCFTRNPADDGADYYGPYYNGFAVKKALRYLRKIFPYYTKPPKPGARPDLDTHIGLSPRQGTTSEEYHATLRKLVRYFEGGRKTLAKEIERDMKTAAGLHDFERAAQLRNKLRDLTELQRRIMFGDREFLDISKDKALSDLAELLGLPKLPVRIEGYDISHMGGTNVVASMVVFTKPVSDVFIESTGDFYVINLHPGQRNASSHSKNLRGGSTTNAHSDVVRLFQRVRDESHRFAVSYHTVLKRQKQTESVLEEIPGIGPATRKKLIKTFGSLRGVKSASREELNRVIGETKATLIQPYL
ncbi:UvrB/UvrC motif-containing protein [Candidatus Saccharibacteria bacterium]|nr:UvrB/UvrC motif-containing protein [Candidatus Saccharibacteria bacterium]